jgi:hypothetical protein
MGLGWESITIHCEKHLEKGFEAGYSIVKILRICSSRRLSARLILATPKRQLDQSPRPPHYTQSHASSSAGNAQYAARHFSGAVPACPQEDFHLHHKATPRQDVADAQYRS